MILKVDAIHTAGVLKPTRDLPLRENQRVRLIVQPIEEPEQDRTAAIARLKAGIASMDFFSDGTAPHARATASSKVKSTCCSIRLPTPVERD